MPYRQEQTGQGDSRVRDEKPENLETGSLGGLLVTAELGQQPLQRINDLQYRVRNLIMRSVEFAVANPNLFEARRPGFTSSDTFIELDPGFVPPMLVLSSSVTVNPWQEVITAVSATSAALGVAGISAASVVKGMQRVPGLLDLSIRLATWSQERNIRKRELRNRAAELDDEFYARLKTMTESSAAQALLDAMEELHELGPIVERVAVRPITEREADAQRRTTLRIVRGDEEQNPE